MAPLVIEFVVMDGDAERREDWLENSPRVKFALDPDLDVRKINGFWAGEGKRRRAQAEFRLEPYVSTFEKAWRGAGGDIDRFFGKLEVEA